MNKLRGAGVAGVLTLVCACFVPACSSDAAAPAGSGLTLYPTTKILDADALGRLVSADEATMVFGSTNAAIDAVTLNDVVLGGVAAKTPNGSMRRVTAITKTGAGVTWTTRQAALTEAIAKGKITIPHTGLHQTGARIALQDGVRTMSRPVMPGQLSTRDIVGGSLGKEFTLGFDGYEVSKGVTLGASVGFGLDVDLSLEIDSTQVTGTFALAGAQSVTLDVNAKYADSFDKTKNLATFEFPPIPIEAGPVPIVITFALSADVGLKGNTKTRLAWSGTENANAKIGLSLGTKGVDPILEGDASAVDDPLQVEGTLTARGTLGLTLTASVNAIVASASLSAGGGGFLSLDADTSKDPCWNLNAGVYGKYGVNTELLGITVLEKEGSKDFATKKIASGACGLQSLAFTTWSDVVTPTGFDSNPSIALYPDNTFLLGSSGAATSGYLARYNPDGTPVWERKITGTFGVRDVLVTPDGTGWVGGRVGTTEGFAHIAADGSPISARKIVGDTGFSSANYVPAKDGGLFIGGWYGSDATAWAARTDPSGAIVWANTYTGMRPYAIAAANDGGVVLFGTSSFSGAAKTVVMRLAPDGKVVFARIYGEGRLFSGTVLSGGGFAAAGSTATAEGVVLRIDDAGALVWGFSYEDPTNPEIDYAGNTIFEEPDGLLVGGSRDFGHASDGWLLRLGTGGELTYSRSYGGPDEDIFTRMLKTPDGGTLIAGTTASFASTSSLFLTHVLQSGAISYSNANAFQHNVEAQKNTLPGSQSVVTPVVTPLAITTAPDTLDAWTGAPVTAPRTLLAE